MSNFSQSRYDIYTQYPGVNISDERSPFSPQSPLRHFSTVTSSSIASQAKQVNKYAAIGGALALAQRTGGTIAREISDTTGNERVLTAYNNLTRGVAIAGILAFKAVAAAPALAVAAAVEQTNRVRSRERNNQALVFENRLRGSRLSSRTIMGAYYD